MRNTMKYLFLAISAVAFFTACREKDSVSIDSLQVFGNEFYYGQTVQVAMAVNMSNPDIADFYWECDGGKFLEEQGYQLNRWQAPSQAGYYTIKCTAKCGSASETREAVVLVSGFFFEKFDGKSGNAVPSGWAQSSSSVQLTNNRMELRVSATSTGQSSGEVRYNMNKADLYPPFSFKSDVGIVGVTATSSNDNTPRYPTDSATFNRPDRYFSGKDNNCAYSITGNTPSATIAPTYFITELRLEWWPAAEHCLSSVTYMPVGGSAPDDSVKYIAGVDYDAFIRFQWTRRADVSAGIPQSQGWCAIPIKTDAFKYFEPQGEVGRNIAMAVTEDYIVRVFVEGVKVFETDQIKNWRASCGDAPLAVKEYKYIYPAQTLVYLDNVYFFLDSELGGL